jgi:NTP pyrophosphatase (non-canonical NTP hydrolase)
MVELSLREAQRQVDSWMRERGWGYWEPLSQLARMTEELGELARIVNHLYGEKPKKSEEAEQELGLEMADLLYTMICLANSQGVDLQDALAKVLQKYATRDAERYGRAAPGGRLTDSRPGAQPGGPTG